MPRFGNYEIEALIGKGGMAEVYRAKAVDGRYSGRTVALKRLLPEFAKDPAYVDLFTGEADLSKLLHHPNVVEVLEVGVIGEIFFMSMEFVDGRDLGQIVAKCKQRNIRLPTDFGVFLTKSLLEALDYAHNARSASGSPLNIVHCDISPSNLFISRSGEIKLGDFGISKAQALDDPFGGDKVWGKAYYLSPEQLDGVVEPSADLWAAATTLYELLTNERPFQGKDADDVARQVRAGRYIPIEERRSDVSPELAAVIKKSLTVKRAQRFQTAREFADALAPLFNELIGNPMAIASVVRGLFGAG